MYSKNMQDGVGTGEWRRDISTSDPLPSGYLVATSMGSGHAGTSNVVVQEAAPTQPQQVQHEATAKANLLLGTSTGLQVLVLFKQGKTQETGYLKMQMLQLCKLTMNQVLLLQRKGVERINPFALVA